MTDKGIVVLSLFDGKYAACSDGTIISYARKNPKKLVGKVGNAGYRMVVLTIDNKKQYHNVHRIIAKAFIPNPKGFREVNHKDGNKLNNSVSNLEWVSARANQIHARNNGLETKCKINMEIAEMIRKDKGTHGRNTRPSPRPLRPRLREVGACKPFQA